MVGEGWDAWGIPWWAWAILVAVVAIAVAIGLLAVYRPEALMT